MFTSKVESAAQKIETDYVPHPSEVDRGRVCQAPSKFELTAMLICEPGDQSKVRYEGTEERYSAALF